MVDIVVTATVNGVPTNGLTDDPEIQIIRADTGAIVQAFVAMTDLGLSGKYTFPFAPTVTLDYAFLIDLDPLASGQVTLAERFFDGAFPGNIDILADQGDLTNLDVPVSSRNAVVPLSAAVNTAGLAANLAAIASLDTFIQGGREIDFVGDDAAGWQRVERDIGGSILRRYDLFDEADVRIDEPVATFIARQGMIARETISP